MTGHEPESWWHPSDDDLGWDEPLPVIIRLVPITTLLFRCGVRAKWMAALPRPSLPGPRKPVTGLPIACPRFSFGSVLAAQRYLTSSPVTARPMIIRWISLVPSKMVKILAVGAVSAGQRPAGPPVSARIQHGLSEMNAGFGSARVRFRRGTNTRREGT